MSNKMNLKMSDWIAVHEEMKQLYDRHSIDQYFHYTSLEGVLGIFNNYIESEKTVNITECTMRATHIKFLNDAKEYNDGIEKLRDYSDNPNDIAVYENIYSISFCGHSDLLSQWKWYGKDSGISIGFNMKNIMYEYWRCDDDKLPVEDRQTKPLSVKYTDEDKKNFYNQIIDINERCNINRDMKDIVNTLFVPFCKDNGFSEERESRLVFYTINAKEKGIGFDIKYNVSNGVIKPTVNVKFKAINKEENIINTLIVGPGQNQNLIFNALIHIFDRNKFYFRDENSSEHICENGVVIKKSAIPFRG